MKKSIILSSIVVLFLGGCSLKPKLPEVNGEFTYTIQTSSIDEEWWRGFGDENLNSLIDKALKNNSNLAIAGFNMQKAKHMLSLRNRDFLPTISLGASATRGENSAEIPPYMSKISNNFSISAVLNYEIDLWGRVRDSSNAAESFFKASKYDYEAARLSLVSNVASTYFSLVALNKQKEILFQTLEAYWSTVEYQKKQFNEGAISELIYLQSVGEYENAKVRLSSIEHNIDLTQGALSLLVEKDYENILYKNENISLELPSAPEVPNGVSSDILLNRPDVASSYERLKASNYMVGVARSAYFPTLSLTGIFGYQSNDLDKLFTSSAQTWSAGGSLLVKLLDFGRTSKQVDIAKIEKDISFIAYDNAIKSALNEIRIALKSRQNAINTKHYLNAFLISQKRIFKLSKDMFDEGYTTQLQLLDAQRILLNAKIQNVESELNLIQSIIDIYKAFGGGFSVNEKAKQIKDLDIVEIVDEDSKNQETIVQSTQENNFSIQNNS